MSSTVAIFYHVLDAQLFKAYLESHQIPCFLADEHMISIHPLYSPAIGGVKVKVHPEHFERAMALYAEYQTDEGTAAETFTCPACHSDHALMLPRNESLYYNEYRCFDCDHTWDDRYLHNINPGHIE